MKNKIIEYLIAAVLIGAFIYGLAAFMVWELNPGEWSEASRVITGIWFLVATGIYALNKEQRI